MELIVISESKLKVMLDPSDLADLHITDTNRLATRETLTEILRKAKASCGFDATVGRLFVQMYPCKRGGCELFVTKLEMRGGKEPVTHSGGERTLTEYKRYTSERRYKSGHIIYAFDEMRHMLSTCACLQRSGYAGDSSAYQDPGAFVYYLSLDEETFFAGEHLGKLCPSSYYYYINEHCRMICDRAVPVLGGLA